jgi:hypothetical protein
VGVGVYARERGEQGEPLARAVVAALGARASWSGDRATWFCPAERLGPGARAIHPAGRHDFGLAHGVPGLLSFLASRARRDSQAADLAAAGARWLLDRRHPVGARTRFPWALAPGETHAPGRTGWCYGDVGVAVALLRVAHALSDEALAAVATDVAIVAAQRSPAACDVHEPGLCHGAAGMALLCQAACELSRSQELSAAATMWLQHAIEQSDRHGCYTWRDGMRLARPGVVYGAAGVGLAMLSAMNGEVPGWARLLLLV